MKKCNNCGKFHLVKDCKVGKQCRKCGSEDHLEKECKVNKETLETMCTYCHETDHKTADCELRKEDEKQARATYRKNSKKYVNLQGAWKQRPAGATQLPAATSKEGMSTLTETAQTIEVLRGEIRTLQTNMNQLVEALLLKQNTEKPKQTEEERECSRKKLAEEERKQKEESRAHTEKLIELENTKMQHIREEVKAQQRQMEQNITRMMEAQMTMMTDMMTKLFAQIMTVPPPTGAPPPGTSNQQSKRQQSHSRN